MTTDDKPDDIQNNPPKPENTNERPPTSTAPSAPRPEDEYQWGNPTSMPKQQQDPAVKEYLQGEPTFSNILSHLLRKPLSIIHSHNEKKNIPWKLLLIMCFISLALFGFIVGTFSGYSDQLWAAPLKIIFGVFFSAAICLPSLYIFSCLGGLNVKFSTVLTVLLCMIAIISLLLVGFAPVLWLFSSSSNSMGFFGFLCLALWGICLIFGLRFVLKTGETLGMKHNSHLLLWTGVFTLVTLQMPTTLRPIIGTSDKLLELDEKKFFLQHWGEEFDREISGDSYDRTPRGVDKFEPELDQ